jgi:hypothetical protein
MSIFKNQYKTKGLVCLKTSILSEPSQLTIPRWEPEPDSYPYTGRGFTGSKEIVLPEYYQQERPFVHGDKLKIIDANTGEVTTTFIYDKKLKWITLE